MKTLNFALLLLLLPLTSFAKAASLPQNTPSALRAISSRTDCDEADEAALRLIILEDQIRTARTSDAKSMVAKQNVNSD